MISRLNPGQHAAMMRLKMNAFGYGKMHRRTATSLIESGYLRPTSRWGFYAITPKGWQKMERHSIAELIERAERVKERKV